MLIMGLNSFATAVNVSGQALTKKYCANCHGEKGNYPKATNKEGIPNIAGFSAILIFDSIDQFKTSDRKPTTITLENGQSKDMKQISQSLSSDEIEAISLYLSQQTFIPAIQPSKENTPQMISEGRQLHQDLCENCHIENATKSDEDAPILMGQWRTYLVKQFDQLSHRERYIPRKMKRKFRKLTDTDKKALIAFYTQTSTRP